MKPLRSTLNLCDDLSQVVHTTFTQHSHAVPAIVFTHPLLIVDSSFVSTHAKCACTLRSPIHF